MIPILFSPEAEPEILLEANDHILQDVNDVELWAAGDPNRAFDTLGLGALTDCISCEVTEERNGEYELEAEYPINGVHFDEIELRCIILAKPNYTGSPQAFRIYSITTPIDGVVTISARHITYDLSGVPVLPFTATSCSAACQGLIDNAAFSTPFTIGTQIGTVADFNASVPASVRSWFGGKNGSLIDVYGGEWAYDNYSCILKSARGADRGVVIRYGVNLIDFEQEKNCEETYTGVLPYWADEDGNVVRANIINLVGSFDYRRILVLDLSLDFEEQPTVQQLTDRANSYITANNIGIPKVNITLDWVQISELSDRVDLCDTVKVVFERIGVETSAKVVRVVWDVLKDRYSEIEIGEPKTNITDTIAGLEQETEKATSSVSTVMLGAIQRATAAITGNSGGYVIMHDGDGDGYPDEILIMDTPDISTATKIWRWNKSGLGYSSSGYNGTFGLAMTANGEIVADYITTGTLNGVEVNLGGSNNQNGLLNVYDDDGDLYARLFNRGLNLYGSGTVSWHGMAPGQSSGHVGFYVGDNDSLVARFGATNNLGETDMYGTLSLYGRASDETLLPLYIRLKPDAGISYYDSDNNAALFRATPTGLTSSVVYTTTSGNAANMVVLSDGSICRSTSSSRRYKHDITDQLDEDPEALYGVRVVQFKYNDDYLSKDDHKYGKDIIGFIAEEVAEAMPGAVDYDDEGRPEMWNVNVVVPSMLKLIQNQKHEIDELKARLDRLEARLLDDDGR